MTDIEQVVVGSMLLDQRMIPSAERAVSGTDFGDTRLGVIFDGLVQMFNAGEPVDALTVSPKLKEWGVAGVDPADLHVWAGLSPTAANVEFYARQVAEAAVSRALLAVAGSIQQDAGVDPGQAIRDAQAALEGLSARHATQAVERYTVEDMLNMDISHDWLVPGLLEHRDRLMLTGAEGLGKSLFLQQIAFGLAAGIHPLFQSQQVESRRVLVLDAENTERQWARRARSFSERIGVQDTGDRLQVAPLRRLDLVNGRDLAMVHRIVADAKPDVIVIGPLYRLVPRAIQTDDEATPLLAALDTFRDDGAALLIEAHAGKSTDGGSGRRNYSPRGSSALLGWPEFGFGMSPRPDMNGLEVDLVRWRGEREKRDWPEALHRSNRGWPWVPLNWRNEETK